MNEFARITSFVRSMAKEDVGALGELYRDAVKRGVPVIRPEARELLKTQLLLKSRSVFWRSEQPSAILLST